MESSQFNVPVNVATFNCDMITNVEVPTMDIESVKQLTSIKQQHLFANHEISHAMGKYE